MAVPRRADLRTAETPIASTVHEPFGSPAGPGLFRVKGLELPAYVQHVAHHLVTLGHPESSAIHMALGIVQDWAAGHAPGGGHVHPDVQAAAAKAVAEWEAAKAAAHAGGGKSSGRSAGMAQAELRAKYSADQMKSMAAKGQAMKNASGEPSYPIADEEDLSNAIHAVGRGGSSHDAIRKHIISRAKAMGKSSMIPDNWNPDGSMSNSDSDSGNRSLAPEIERRRTPGVVEVRAMPEGGGRRIGGYGAVFGKLSRNLGGFVEKVGDTAFNQSRTLGWPGVVCRLNHDRNQLLGTTEGRTLALRTDSIGLDYEVEPPPSRQDIVELVGRGDIRHSSFAFECPPGGDEWRTTDQYYPLRVLHEVRLLDVSPVTGDEAYNDATAGLRSLAHAMDAPFEEVRSMAAADELRRFFTRTDNRGPAKPEPPKVPAMAAMMTLMERRRDPWADQG